MKFPRRFPLVLAIAALTAAVAASAPAQISPPPDSGTPAQPDAALPRGGTVGPNSDQRGTGLPRADVLEAMAKAALMALNDANLTGNYSVMNARLHPEFRVQAPAEKLAGIFAPFRTSKIDFAAMLVHTPTYTDGPRIDADGLLVVKGYMETRPWRTSFDLAWRQSAGNWWLWKINVNVRPPAQ